MINKVSEGEIVSTDPPTPPFVLGGSGPIRILTDRNPAARPWFERAAELASFAWLHLVNRTDVWVSYLSLSKRSGGRKALTSPPPEQRGELRLTTDVIHDHFAAQSASSLIALHAIGPTNTSKWFGVDLDAHGDPDHDRAFVNLLYARLLGKRCSDFGIDTLLVDSNGLGGIHLWGILSSPIATKLLWSFLNWLTRDESTYLGSSPDGQRRVEVFPHCDGLPAGGFGRALRLPGRHHTHSEFFSRVRDSATERWLTGNAAIDRIVGLPLIDPLRLDPILVLEADRLRRLNPERPNISDVKGGPSTHRITSSASHKCRRAAAYLQSLPKRLSDGRKRTAYNFAAFLAGDLGMKLDEMTPWLLRWDSRNKPRLQDEPGIVNGTMVNKLIEIANNAQLHNRSNKLYSN